MRRSSRKENNNKKNISDKTMLYSVIGAIALILIVLGAIVFSNGKKEEEKFGSLSANKLNVINNTVTQNTQTASTEMGKTVEESQRQNTVENTTTKVTENKTKDTANKANETSNKTAITNSNTKKNTTKKEEVKKEISFSKPVEGEIIREFAKDQLVYSNTLEEWTTHVGIDIKADETTIVGAAANGKVKSIKNDPRYGQTVVIEHEDGYQTIYSNLLTSEFVVEGENIQQGQTIGTVGKTAAFEAKDDPHLHFEILKDFENIDPNTLIK